MNAEIIARLARTCDAGQKIENEQLEELTDLLAEKVAAKLAAKKNLTSVARCPTTLLFRVEINSWMRLNTIGCNALKRPT